MQQSKTYSHQSTRFQKNKLTSFEDKIAKETALLIQLQFSDGGLEDLVITMQTPGDETALGVGFLYTEGIIDSFEEVAQITLIENGILIHLKTKSRNLPGRNTVSSAACGMCGKTSMEALDLVRDQQIQHNTIQMAGQDVLKFNEKIKPHQEMFNATGGIHAAAIFDEQGSLLLLKEDIGRHNAVDKAIGQLLIDKVDPAQCVMLVSGRAGFELVQKCIVSGIAIMLAVGAPSSLAIEYAQEYGLTLIGFLKNEQFNIYTHSQRIKL